MSLWPLGETLSHSGVDSILDEYYLIFRSVKCNTASPIDDCKSKPLTEPESEFGAEPRDRSDLNQSFIDRILLETALLDELNEGANDRLVDFICLGYFFDDRAQQVNHMNYLVDMLMAYLKDIDRTGYRTSFLLESSFHQTGEYNDQDEDPMLYVNIISSIFCSKSKLITESLAQSLPFLSSLLEILQFENIRTENCPILAVFLKINESLLFEQTSKYLNFFKSQMDIVDNFLNHIEVSPLIEFLIKVVLTDQTESPTGIIEFLHEQNLIPKCLNFLDNSMCSPGIQNSSGELLKALISISTNFKLDTLWIGPNLLIRQLASPQYVDQLIDIVLLQRGHAMGVAVSIIIELIRKNNSDYDAIDLLDTTIVNNPPSQRDPIYLGHLLYRLTMHMEDFYALLIILDNDDDDDDDDNDDDNYDDDNTNIKGPASGNHHLLENQLHESFKPLGLERVKITELISEMLHCSNMGLMNSKRAEKIACARDKCREALGHNLLEEAMDNLSINGKILSSTTLNDECSNDSNDRNDNRIKKRKSKRRFNDNELYSTFDTFDDDSNDDMSFEIPYVSEAQNLKLRKNPTIGDLFKIKLHDLGFLPKFLQLFLRYPWNNFWHNIVFDIIQQIFNGRMDFSYTSFLVYSLFDFNKSRRFIPKNFNGNNQKCPATNFHIISDFILQGHKDSFEFYEKEKTNLGYMGQLVLIAEEVAKYSKMYRTDLIAPDICAFLQDEVWMSYSNEILNETRTMCSIILGGGQFMAEDNKNNNLELSEGPDMNQETSASSTMVENETAHDENGLLRDKVVELIEELGHLTESDIHDKIKDVIVDHQSELVN
ncbi:AIS_HP2_G0017090.mRNA.1.CDS.1 [Saccharomyces cerevisiae]|nr:AIS_HP2_G0017090.mRNA.1.CDS.1 [Saccharomyces cerevisiae]CAI6496188.1 AIS_HP2_G0017090.mRNA.1.CDS.1 [Saccharomyces cerevisiae]